jgi:hypothetical protein
MLRVQEVSLHNVAQRRGRQRLELSFAWQPARLVRRRNSSIIITWLYQEPLRSVLSRARADMNVTLCRLQLILEICKSRVNCGRMSAWESAQWETMIQPRQEVLVS